MSGTADDNKVVEEYQKVLDEKDAKLLADIKAKLGTPVDDENTISILIAVLTGDKNIHEYSDLIGILSSPRAKAFRYLLKTYPFLDFSKLLKLTIAQMQFLLIDDGV